jgi:hypothetical protein
LARVSRILVWALALCVFWMPNVFAQQAQQFVDIATGPRDVLYSQGQLLETIDQSWFAPLPSTAVLVASLDDPNIMGLAPLVPTDTQPKSSDTSSVQPVYEKKAENSMAFRWKPAFGEALLFTGIQHAFNITTEAGTRDALNGPWLKDYLRSVSELRGWSDGDRFMAPYVGHPIEGSVFAFIERQNDPKFEYVQWGDGREYWISMLRSMAYSAVWHTQWKIGPVSEASIGNVMLHASPGFITLVDTPTLGFVVMMTEDIADRYVIMGLENRTSNRMLIILTRSFLNPGRTFANMMAFKVPWHRDTRMGLFGDYFILRQEMLEDYKNGTGEKPFIFVKDSWKPAGIDFTQAHPKEADIELSAISYYESFLGGGSCIGGGGQGAARVNPKWQVITEVSGCLVMHQPQYEMSADSLFYGGGFRWTPLASHRFSPFSEFMVGGRKVTYEIDNLALRKELLKEWNNGNGTLPHYPMRSAWSFETAQNGPSIAVGGGVDWVVTRPFAWRILDVQYTRSWMNDVMGVRPQEGVKVSTQAVVRIGTW